MLDPFSTVQEYDGWTEFATAYIESAFVTVTVDDEMTHRHT